MPKSQKSHAEPQHPIESARGFIPRNMLRHALIDAWFAPWRVNSGLGIQNQE
jgi:hypothetical protein